MKKTIVIEGKLYNSGRKLSAEKARDIMSLMMKTILEEMICLHWTREGYSPYVNTHFRFSEN